MIMIRIASEKITGRLQSTRDFFKFITFQHDSVTHIKCFQNPLNTSYVNQNSIRHWDNISKNKWYVTIFTNEKLFFLK